VTLEATFETRESLFFVLEYCPGGTLDNILRQKNYFDAQTAQIYAAQILLALEHLHD
jgi:serine/threonine protein kinase